MSSCKLLFILFYFLFQKYLVPQAQKQTGIEKDKVEIVDDAMKTLIKSYCRESGVRNLQKHIEKVGISFLKSSLLKFDAYR